MSFVLAHLESGHIPEVQEKVVATSVTSFLRGALLIVTSDEWVEAGADPAPLTIIAVAESDYGAETAGFGGTGRKEFPPGYMQATLVRGSDRPQFFAEYTGSLPAANGGTYGVVKSADGKWRVDFGETTADVVKLIDRLPFPLGGMARVKVEFIDAVVA